MARAALPSTRTEELIAQLRLICGREHVFTDAATLQTFSADAIAHYRQSPLAAVMPGSVAECQAIVRTCAAAEIPFVTRGAGTGLAAGALPLESSVVIALGRLHRILSVDLDAGLIFAEAGATAIEIERAAGPTHHYPPLSATANVATIGGNVATNAGGPLGPHGGATADFVMGLDVVLADGTELELRRDQIGYDLLDALIGSEGTFGIVVRVLARIAPAPAGRLLLRADFPSLAAAANAGALLAGTDLAAAAVEVLDCDTLTRALAGRRSPWVIAGDPTAGNAGVLLAELVGERARCKRDATTAVEVFREHGATTMRITADPPPAARLHSLRAAIVPAATGLPAYYLSDIVVPVSAVTRTLEELGHAAETACLTVVSLVRPLIGSVLSKIAYDPRQSGDAQAARELAARFAAIAVGAGGSVGGEHGIGVDKLEQLVALRALDDLDCRQRAKQAFDPRRLANPTKLFPEIADRSEPLGDPTPPSDPAPTLDENG